MTYPPALRGDDADVLHGVTVPDPYRRLEDPADPATVDWSRAQDDLLESHRAGWRARKRLHDRLTEPVLRVLDVGTEQDVDGTSPSGPRARVWSSSPPSARSR